MHRRDDRLRPLSHSLSRLGTTLAILIAIPSSLTAGLFAQPLPVRSSPTAQNVRIRVLSLFRPRELILRPAPDAKLRVKLAGETHALPPDLQSIRIRATGGLVKLETQDGSNRGQWQGTTLEAHLEGGPYGAARFWLEVPGKLRRQYGGDLEVRARGDTLEAVVTMPLESAVASVVAAESPAGAGTEALKAQAVAARSFLVARQTTHKGFDFCDTTHCQFLRSPPAEGSAASTAARATEGLVLTWHDQNSAQDRILAAMYGRSCGGRTRTLRDIGAASLGYPYYAVHCVYCSRHPEVWRREIDGISAVGNEKERLNFNRIHGWGAIPGNTQDAQNSAIASGANNTVSGRGIGHGVGLCQLGASAMARNGASFARILAHYYPNTQLARLP